ncbi:VirD4-like conjugal transfer protein, CD1115 family [Fusibacillus kribbianus]|uniref:VirD4-like conjugal transfer protein, CD1115 family n=1 Tax=Fusibacillus kribbianus TaxID=3044208 RepID=UPI0024B4E076|nr:type IV secretory system conjugative DNA transfer family protein [Ruminococcus sp. YH-rum2234]
MSYQEAWILLFTVKQVKIWWLILQMVFGVAMIYLYWLMPVQGKVKDVTTIRVTDNIEIPVAVGNGQYGTAKFMEKSDLEKYFSVYRTGSEFKGPAGLVVHMERNGSKEKIYYNTMVPHSLVVGATGAGKTRRILLETMYLQMLSGVSVICSDVKGELYYYTNRFARNQGYHILPLDFRRPEKSVHYNFLQPILDAFESGNDSKAVDATWDLVSAIVKESSGEPLWYNGEMATIAAAILIVAKDAPPKHRNCVNVYYFLAYMCQPREDGSLPLNDYLKMLPDTHPAKGVFALAQVAPSKTRASFFTSALSTLRLFTSPSVADMTSRSDFKLDTICREKTMLYIMIPDEKKTLYPLVSIFITQAYGIQVEVANEYGTKLPVGVDYDLDELGNFPYIPVLSTMYSAGRSRGIHVNGIIQDYQQLERNYKEEFRNIKSNAQLKMYLKTDDTQTLKDFSENLGTYTVESPSVSSSVSGGKHGGASYSSSSNMTSRSLLEPAEIGKIHAPYALCKITGVDPLISNLPDLSEYSINDDYGLGDEEFNRKLMQSQENDRSAREVRMDSIGLWMVWKDYENPEPKNNRRQEAAMSAAKQKLEKPEKNRSMFLG